MSCILDSDKDDNDDDKRRIGGGGREREGRKGDGRKHGCSAPSFISHDDRMFMFFPSGHLALGARQFRFLFQRL